jgi:DNA-binding transcriptional LysR family regulator
MDRIAAMTTFVRVVEAGNFTRAADTMDLPKATVTRLIQGLEAELGVLLLQRTTRSLALTAEGAAYYERVVRLLADLADIEANAKQSLAKPSGRVRVETAAAVATNVIVPALPDFYARYPDVEVEIGIGNRTVDLIADNVDCAIRAGEITDESLVARRIGEFRFATCASPGYLKAHGTPAVPDDLQNGHRTVGLVTSRGRARPFVFSDGKDGGQQEKALAYRLLVNDTNTYLAAALAGVGIIQAPLYALQQAFDEHRLVPVLEAWTTPATPLYVIYPPNRFLSAKVRVFIDWMAALCDRSATLRRR